MKKTFKEGDNVKFLLDGKFPGEGEVMTFVKERSYLVVKLHKSLKEFVMGECIFVPSEEILSSSTNDGTDQFQEGYECFSKAGASFDDNPYSKNTQQWQNWQAGFGAAWSNEIGTY